jgi:hypothetical protein
LRIVEPSDLSAVESVGGLPDRDKSPGDLVDDVSMPRSNVKRGSATAPSIHREKISQGAFDAPLARITPRPMLDIVQRSPLAQCMRDLALGKPKVSQGFRETVVQHGHI